MSSKNEAEARAAWSLATRLTAWYSGTAFLLILAATSFLYAAIISHLDQEDDQYLADKVRFLRLLLRDRPRDVAALSQQAEGEWSGQYTQFYVRVLDDTGRIRMESPGMSEELPPTIFPEATAEPNRGVEIETASGKSFRLLAVRAASHVIQAALDRTYEENLLAGYRRNLWLVLAIALVACTAIGYQIARRGLQPVAEITATARRIRSTTLNERIDVKGLPAELFVLAGTFNGMLDRLEESFNRLARFSADIAHELRTPVNNLRGEAEVALGKPRSPAEYREVLGSCLEECARLARIIDNLLFLARAESPEMVIEREGVDVGQEVAAIRDFYEAAAAEAGVTLAAITPEGVLVDLNRTLFQRALGNLVANALASTPAGGRITLAVFRREDTVCVEVEDTGCGISAEHLAHVFDRFYRVDAARSSASGGVGLGLAIVKSITLLHRGSVAIASQEGQGTRVTLIFPALQQTGEGLHDHPAQTRR
jgi:two-component system heavy metal sensor histidine kinase CusS